MSQSLGQEIKEKSENVTVPTKLQGGKREWALLPMKAVPFPVRDFHFFLVDNSGLDQVVGKMRRMVLNLIQNAANDVFLSCDSKLQF